MGARVLTCSLVFSLVLLLRRVYVRTRLFAPKHLTLSTSSVLTRSCVVFKNHYILGQAVLHASLRNTLGRNGS